MSAALPQSDLDQTEFPWMSSAEDFLAKTLVTPGKAQGLRAQDQDYGAKSPAWLASYDRNTSSWKMSQHSLVEGLDEFSETWPRSGMMRNGIAYQLPPLALRTDATGSGLWPTPLVVDTGLTTDLDKIQARRERIKAKGINGNGFGLSLGEAARLWPTPRSCSAMGANFTENTPKAKFPNLETVVARQMWPTPNAGDYKAGMSNAPNRQQSSLPRSVGIAEGVSSGKRGGLNPTWVEWLMGFPLQWTVSKVWETRLSRKSQK
jgi:DNA (cytosine-5)-methyltransferase 1